MPVPTTLAPPEASHLTRRMLHELSVPVHRLGYKQLCTAIPLYARDDVQSLTKELYPSIARQFGHSNWHSVEHAIRLVILDAWEDRRTDIWEEYFPNLKRPPSNKRFIATLAERLTQIPSSIEPDGAFLQEGLHRVIR